MTPETKVNGWVYIRPLKREEIQPGMLVMDNSKYDESGNLPVTVLSVNKLLFQGTSPTFEGPAWFSLDDWHLVMEDSPYACMWCGENVPDNLETHEQECGG